MTALYGMPRRLTAEAKPGSGRWITHVRNNAASTGTVTLVANRMEAFPFVCQITTPVDRFGVNVNTGAASAKAKVVIYSDNAGVPDKLLYESAELDCSTSSTQPDTGATSFTFEAGVQYWLGWWANGTPTLISFNSQWAPLIDCGTSISTTRNAVLDKTVTYASAANSAPASWSYSATQANNNNPPALYMRMA